MARVIDFISKPRNQIRFWAFWTMAWLVLDPITMFTGLRSSVPWLEEMSLFANFASCGTALVAAWSYYSAKRVDDANLHAKLDHIITSHPDIPPLQEGEQ